MLNTVEVYGRTKSIDQHREEFGKLKNAIKKTSIPPPIKKPYPDVWPTSYHNNDGEKLVIGTQFSNVLITSSIRLDTSLDPSVGGTTVHFNLHSIQDSLSCKMHLDRESLALVAAMVNDASTNGVSGTGSLTLQLRQLRSKFHFPTTYLLCRASGPITKAHNCQPYTVFTLSDFDRGRNPSSTVFRSIAYEVLKNGREAKLQKSVLLNIVKKVSIKEVSIVQAIIDLFEGDDEHIPLLGNVPLNDQLSSLAKQLSSAITTANGGVEKEIKAVFECLD